MLARLKAARIRPAVLARALEVDRSTASLMLSGKRGIPTWHLDAIAKLLHVEVPELFTRSDLIGQEVGQDSDPLRGSDAAAVVTDSTRRLALAQELTVLANLADDLKCSIHDVASRFTGDMASTENTRATGAHSRKQSHRISRPRKAG